MKMGHASYFKKEMYEKTLRILQENGYITRKEIFAIFNVHSIEFIYSYFERENNPLYIETMVVKKMKTGKYKTKEVFKLFNVVKKQWREENRRGKYTNAWQGNTSAILRS